MSLLVEKDLMAWFTFETHFRLYKTDSKKLLSHFHKYCKQLF